MLTVRTRPLKVGGTLMVTQWHSAAPFVANRSFVWSADLQFALCALSTSRPFAYAQNACFFRPGAEGVRRSAPASGSKHAFVVGSRSAPAQ